MFCKNDFKAQVEQTLKSIDLYSEKATYLLMGTCAQESSFGKYTKQLGGGPALGVFQMEPATFNDIVKNYLRYKPELTHHIMEVADVDRLEPEYLVDNLPLAICMARVHYLRVSEPIPDNLGGWAYYWKRYYNTHLGKGTETEFINNFKKFVI